MQCPPSAMLTADMPDPGSPFAAEGTLAHAVGELKLREHFLSPLGVKRFAKALQKLKGDTADDTWMEILHCTDEYLDAVIEIATAFPSAPYVAVEQRVAFDEWVPEGFGTADCVMVCGDVLHIVDYKHGKGVAVDAENNPQMMLYALGAYRRYLPLYPIKTLRWTIVQPRNGGISEPQEWAVADLVTWADTQVRPRAQLAAEGKGEFNPGDWCRFCKAKAACRARSDHNLSLEGFEKKLPPLLSHAEIGDALRRAQDLKGWVSTLEEYALSALLEGLDIPGWKAVEGRALRTWTDQEAAFRAAQELGTPEVMLYERKPVSLAALEKLMGKKAFQPLTAYVTVPPGKPTLAPENDKREAIKPGASAEEDFQIPG